MGLPYDSFEKVAGSGQIVDAYLDSAFQVFFGPDGREPSFEGVLRVMYEAGYRGDVYPSLRMWELAPTGVFASYPFPKSLDVMRKGGF